MQMLVLKGSTFYCSTLLSLKLGYFSLITVSNHCVSYHTEKDFSSRIFISFTHKQCVNTFSKTIKFNQPYPSVKECSDPNTEVQGSGDVHLVVNAPDLSCSQVITYSCSSSCYEVRSGCSLFSAIYYIVKYTVYTLYNDNDYHVFMYNVYNI